MSLRYCGRDFSDDEIKQIQSLIAEDKTRRRAELSRRACQTLAWYKPDGGLKDMSARVAMLRMQKDGHIQLPPPHNKRPDANVCITSHTDQGKAIEMPASQLSPLRLEQVKLNAPSRLWNEYIRRYHYLGHKLLPGAQRRYFVYANKQPVALLSFGAAAWQTAPRDHYIGWRHEQRQWNLHLVVNKASASCPRPLPTSL